MICYRDRTYCGNESCDKYDSCKDAFPYAVKEAEGYGLDTKHLSFSVCMTRECSEYSCNKEVKNREKE